MFVSFFFQVFGVLLIVVLLAEVGFAIAQVIMPARQIAGVYLVTPTLTALTMVRSHQDTASPDIKKFTNQ